MPVTSTARAIPAGTVGWFAASTAPAGFIKANGAAVSRSTYAALFQAIGTTYGAGDGSTTFNVPDLRGEFLRGWDDGRGVDSGRGIGTAQQQNLPSHQHQTANGFDSSNSFEWRDASGNPIWGSVVDAVAGRNSYPVQGLGTGGRFAYTKAEAENQAGESRPRNVALLACIKF